MQNAFITACYKKSRGWELLKLGGNKFSPLFCSVILKPLLAWSLELSLYGNNVVALVLKINDVRLKITNISSFQSLFIQKENALFSISWAGTGSPASLQIVAKELK